MGRSTVRSCRPSGQTFFEELHYDENGQPLTTTLLDYTIPTFGDASWSPASSTARRPRICIGGYRGAGEGALIVGPVALAAAVHDALVPLGVPDHPGQLEPAAPARPAARGHSAGLSERSAPRRPRAELCGPGTALRRLSTMEARPSGSRRRLTAEARVLDEAVGRRHDPVDSRVIRRGPDRRHLLLPVAACPAGRGRLDQPRGAGRAVRSPGGARGPRRSGSSRSTRCCGPPQVPETVVHVCDDIACRVHPDVPRCRDGRWVCRSTRRVTSRSVCTPQPVPRPVRPGSGHCSCNAPGDDHGSLDRHRIGRGGSGRRRRSARRRLRVSSPSADLPGSPGRIGLVDPDQPGGLPGARRLSSAARPLWRWDPRRCLREIADSGLRGRGGAAFPTGVKWRAVASSAHARSATSCRQCGRVRTGHVQGPGPARGRSVRPRRVDDHRRADRRRHARATSTSGASTPTAEERVDPRHRAGPAPARSARSGCGPKRPEVRHGGSPGGRGIHLR